MKTFELISLEIGGLVIDPSTLTRARIASAGSEWNISLRAHEGGAFDLHILTTRCYDVRVHARLGDSYLAGIGTVYCYGPVIDGDVIDDTMIEVVLIGTSALTPAPAAEPPYDEEARTAFAQMRSDGWREVSD